MTAPRYHRLRVRRFTKNQINYIISESLSGCPRKNRPINFDQIFNFLQTFCARQGWYRINVNTFRSLVNFIIPEILRQMLLVPKALKSPFRRVEISQFGKVCCRPYIYPKNLTFIPVIHTSCYSRNMVGKVQIIETCLNERVSNWPTLTVSARSGSSGKTKTNVSQSSLIVEEVSLVSANAI